MVCDNLSKIMGQMPESGTFPQYKMVLVLRVFFFAILVYVQKDGVLKLLRVP